MLLGDDLLREATFGISLKWHAKELNKLKRDLLRGINTVLNRKSLKGRVQHNASQVEVILNDDAERQVAINMLLKANSEQLALKDVNGQLDIEDGIDESSSVSEV